MCVHVQQVISLYVHSPLSPSFSCLSPPEALSSLSPRRPFLHQYVVVGVRRLCRRNFGNNWTGCALSIKDMLFPFLFFYLFLLFPFFSFFPFFSIYISFLFPTCLSDLIFLVLDNEFQRTYVPDNVPGNIPVNVPDVLRDVLGNFLGNILERSPERCRERSICGTFSATQVYAPQNAQCSEYKDCSIPSGWDICRAPAGALQISWLDVPLW